MAIVQINRTNFSGGSSSSGTSEAIVKSIVQSSHGFSVGNVLRWNASISSYVLALADSEENAEIVGIISSTSGSSNFSLLGFPSSGKRYERDIIIKIKQEDEDEWKFLFIENVDDNTDILFAKVIGIVGDEEKAKKVSFRIQEQVSKGNKNFKLSVKEA